MCSWCTARKLDVLFPHTKQLPSSTFSIVSVNNPSLLTLWQIKFETDWRCDEDDGLWIFAKLNFCCSHQWCYYTGLWVSNPFWCDEHALIIFLEQLKYAQLLIYIFKPFFTQSTLRNPYGRQHFFSAFIELFFPQILRKPLILFLVALLTVSSWCTI